MHHKRLDFLKSKLWMENMFAVDSVGRSGNLVLLWKDDFNIVIQNYSQSY